MRPIAYDKLEDFLKGEVSLEDLDTRRYNRYDVTAIAYALAVPHLGDLTYQQDGMLCLKDSLTATLKKHCPYFIYGSHVDASREFGFHVSRQGALTRLTLPAEFIELVERYKDLPTGGIAKFTALKRAQELGKPDEDGITPDKVAADVIARLRKTYGNDVLEIIRQLL